MKDDGKQRLVDFDFPVVLDEAYFPELVHEQIRPRARGTDHLRQHLLRYLLNYPLRLIFLAVASEQQKRTRQSLLRRVKELIELHGGQVTLVAALPAYFSTKKETVQKSVRGSNQTYAEAFAWRAFARSGSGLDRYSHLDRVSRS